jgi:ADP-heptose:LPS heptosyltransferase
VSGQPVLVVKLGALGDFIQALGPMAAIRQHHPDQQITLLTTALYQPLARASGLVDHIQIDERPRGLKFGKWLALRKFLVSGGFGRVYDLQTSDRSSWYYRLFFPGAKPEWSGISPGCSHPHANPSRDLMHTIDRQHEQLRMAGIEVVPLADLSWAEADLSRFELPERFALLVPGGAPHRPAKRWPVAHFRALSERLSERNIVPVILGTDDERVLARDILSGHKGGMDLTGKTDLLALAALARRATCAVGNDTGPMHVTALAGCPSVVLFSDESDPKLCAPRGQDVKILRAPALSDLAVEQVMSALS